MSMIVRVYAPTICLGLEGAYPFLTFESCAWTLWDLQLLLCFHAYAEYGIPRCPTQILIRCPSATEVSWPLLGDVHARPALWRSQRDPAFIQPGEVRCPLSTPSFS